MARKEYDPQLKAAVMAALLSGQSIGAVAAEYNVPRGTVHSWKRKVEGVPQIGSAQEQREIGELVMDYLRASLRTLKAQVEFFGDKTWLSRQNASELAVLHGVQTDKAIRLLEALEGPPDESI
jgi:transposase-like protein